jgi:hypothetical protein
MWRMRRDFGFGNGISLHTYLHLVITAYPMPPSNVFGAVHMWTSVTPKVLVAEAIQILTVIGWLGIGEISDLL